MKWIRLHRLFLLLLWCSAVILQGADAPAEKADRKSIALETLSRLKGIDLEANPAVKAAVLKTVETVKGTPEFVELVRDFKLSGQEQPLLDIALKNATNATGVEAGRLILGSPAGSELLKAKLSAAPPEAAVRAAEVLGNIGDKRTVPWLMEIVTNEQRDVNLRTQSVRSLAKIEDGALALLALAKADKLPLPVKFAASTELNSAHWPHIKSEAAQLLPLPQGRDAEPLPPLSELMRRKGDPKRGAELFSRTSVGCNNCHRVNGQGIDFGPNLSEIGTKLGKDALHTSILDPSAGISFGYEGWQIELKNGDEAFGIIVSETPDELSLKAQNGIVSSYKKSQITKRNKMALSIMPAGLQQTMSLQDLVDLVEFLASLKAVH